MVLSRDNSENERQMWRRHQKTRDAVPDETEASVDLDILSLCFTAGGGIISRFIWPWFDRVRGRVKEPRKVEVNTLWNAGNAREAGEGGLAEVQI
jgi:hypothetical protein